MNKYSHFRPHVKNFNFPLIFKCYVQLTKFFLQFFIMKKIHSVYKIQSEHQKKSIKIEAIIETASAFHLDFAELLRTSLKLPAIQIHTQKHLRELIKFRCYQAYMY